MANLFDCIEDVNTRLLKNIQYELIDIRREVNEKIQKISQQFSDELLTTHKQIKSIRRRIKILEQRVNRQHTKCHIIIRNIPFNQNENLQYIFQQICNQINFHILHSCIEIYRKEFCIKYGHGNKENYFVYPQFIEVCFISIWERKYFMKQYMIYGALYLNDIGFDGKSQVLISENISDDELRMFYLAVIVRQTGLFEYIYFVYLLL